MKTSFYQGEFQIHSPLEGVVGKAQMNECLA